MILGLILSVLSATFNVASTTTVEASLDVPQAASHCYARSAESGQKGQMTAGNSISLTLNNWGGCTLKAISLQMRSNTSSGVGSLSVKVGNDKIWEIHNQAFSHEEWNGAYSTDWVDIQRNVECKVEDNEPIEIVLSATENSLYIKSYTITYEPAEPSAYMVEFVTGFDSVPPAITQQEIGAPIVLPQWKDTLGWYFLGWSTIEIEQSTTCPELLIANTPFTPTTNTRLWAVYTDNDANYAVSEYTSGDYVITQINDFTEGISGEGMGWAMHGKIYNGEISLKPLAIAHDTDQLPVLQQAFTNDMAYTLNFVSDTTVYITNTLSGEHIGYKNTALSAKEIAWMYRVLDDGTLAIYYVHNQKSYALWLGFGPNGTNSNATAFVLPVKLDHWTSNGFWLFPAIAANYTSWPCGKLTAIEKTEVDKPLSSEYMLQMGIYQLRVKDGKKFLHLSR